MTTETWSRGLPYTSAWWRTRVQTSTGILLPWTVQSGNRARNGRTELVSSVRGATTRNGFRNAQEWSNGSISGLMWHELSKAERERRKAIWRIVKQNLPAVQNPYYHYFRGVRRSIPGASPWMARSHWQGGGRVIIDGYIAAHASPTDATAMDLPAIPTSVVKGVESGLWRKATQPGFESALQIGEFMETLAMLRSPLQALRGASEQLWHTLHKRTRKLKGEELVEAASGVWLEWSFGLAPLIFGTAEIANSLVEALYPGMPMTLSERMRSKVSHEVKSNQRRVYTVAESVEVDCSIDTVTAYEVRGGIRLANNDNGRRSLAARLGLNSMRTIVAQGWALMPLSFAVDWFVGIGPLLEECRPLDRKIVESYITTVRRHSVLCNVLRVRPSNTTVWHPCISECHMEHVETNRTAGISPPGTLQLGPGLFSVSQGLSLAALSAGPISKLWRKTPWH